MRPGYNEKMKAWAIKQKEKSCSLPQLRPPEESSEGVLKLLKFMTVKMVLKSHHPPGRRPVLFLLHTEPNEDSVD